MARSRQLAAIMFTDIEGYTALMQQNEKDAIKVRNKHRQVFDSLTEKHQGKILQYYGDGTLSIFASAIEAVECGIEMQLGFLKKPPIPVRIGIHIGDIIFSEDEIMDLAMGAAFALGWQRFIEAFGIRPDQWEKSDPAPWVGVKRDLRE